VFYVDSSAILKVVFAEAQSKALRTWWKAQPEGAMATSALSSTECGRAAKAVGAPAAVLETLDTIIVLEADRALYKEALELPPAILRSLDAVHVASALRLRPDLTAVVTDDDRMAEACALANLEVARTGA
jgi:predicted nucleic acid-binding protein